MLLEAQDLGRVYRSGSNRLTALQNVSLPVEPGEYVAIMGPSGSGKTTLMNLLGLLDRPSSGTLRILGADTAELSADHHAQIRNRSIGFVFQSYNLLPRHTAIENVELPMIYSGIARAERRQRALQFLELIGLDGRASHWPHQLSGGEQQRVAIARAIVNNPALILADEPTGALDSRTGARVLALFKALNEAGRTVIIITHDENVALHARRIIRLKDGRVVTDELVQERAMNEAVKSGDQTAADAAISEAVG
jgi:putative ABC transport system ATP-binding protein